MLLAGTSSVRAPCGGAPGKKSEGFWAEVATASKECRGVGVVFSAAGAQPSQGFETFGPEKDFLFVQSRAMCPGFPQEKQSPLFAGFGVATGAGRPPE